MGQACLSSHEKTATSGEEKVLELDPFRVLAKHRSVGGSSALSHSAQEKGDIAFLPWLSASGDSGPECSPTLTPQGGAGPVKTPRRHLCLAEGDLEPGKGMESGSMGVGGQCGTSVKVPWRPSVGAQPEGPLHGRQCPAVGVVSGSHLPNLQESSFLNLVGAQAG